MQRRRNRRTLLANISARQSRRAAWKETRASLTTSSSYSSHLSPHKILRPPRQRRRPFCPATHTASRHPHPAPPSPACCQRETPYPALEVAGGRASTAPLGGRTTQVHYQTRSSADSAYRAPFNVPSNLFRPGPGRVALWGMRSLAGRGSASATSHGKGLAIPRSDGRARGDTLPRRPLRQPPPGKRQLRFTQSERITQLGRLHVTPMIPHEDR